MKKISIFLLLLLFIVSSSSCASQDKTTFIQIESDFSDKTTNYGVSMMNYADYDYVHFYLENDELVRYYLVDEEKTILDTNVTSIRGIGEILLYIKHNARECVLCALNRTTSKSEILIRDIFDYIILNGEVIYRKCKTNSKATTADGLYILDKDGNEKTITENFVATYWQYNGSVYYFISNGDVYCFSSSTGERLVLEKAAIESLKSLNDAYSLSNVSSIYNEGFFYDGVFVLPYAPENTLFCFTDIIKNGRRANLWKLTINESGIERDNLGELNGYYKYIDMRSVIARNDLADSIMLGSYSFVVEHDLESKSLNLDDCFPQYITDNLCLWRYPSGPTAREASITQNGFIYSTESGEIAYKPKYLSKK